MKLREIIGKIFKTVKYIQHRVYTNKVIIFIFSKLTEEKSKEKQSLMDAEKNVRSITSEKIKEMHESVGKKFVP